MNIKRKNSRPIIVIKTDNKRNRDCKIGIMKEFFHKKGRKIRSVQIKKGCIQTAIQLLNPLEIPNNISEEKIHRSTSDENKLNGNHKLNTNAMKFKPRGKASAISSSKMIY